MLDELDPNDFVDRDKAFGDGYDRDRITLASFEVIRDGDMAHASLEYNERGFAFLGGSGGPKWAINLYAGYHYNGQSLPLHDPDEARHVLEKLSGTDSLEEYDWVAQNWTYFE